MARKIFVGSLPNQVTEELLRAEFDRFGDIDEIFIKDLLHDCCGFCGHGQWFKA